MMIVYQVFIRRNSGELSLKGVFKEFQTTIQILKEEGYALIDRSNNLYHYEKKVGNATYSADIIPIVFNRYEYELLCSLISKGNDEQPIDETDSAIIPKIELVSKQLDGKRKSNLVKWMMKQSGTKSDKLAEHLKCTKQSLNNKFYRDSFSFEDILISADACNFHFMIVSDDNDCKRRIELEDFLQEES